MSEKLAGDMIQLGYLMNSRIVLLTEHPCRLIFTQGLEGFPNRLWRKNKEVYFRVDELPRNWIAV